MLFQKTIKGFDFKINGWTFAAGALPQWHVLKIDWNRLKWLTTEFLTQDSFIFHVKWNFDGFCKKCSLLCLIFYHSLNQPPVQGKEVCSDSNQTAQRLQFQTWWNEMFESHLLLSMIVRYSFGPESRQDHSEHSPSHWKHFEASHQ